MIKLYNLNNPHFVICLVESLLLNAHVFLIKNHISYFIKLFCVCVFFCLCVFNEKTTIATTTTTSTYKNELN